MWSRKNAVTHLVANSSKSIAVTELVAVCQNPATHYGKPSNQLLDFDETATK